MNPPLNIAHRRFTRDSPDNTHEAFQAAITLDIDGIVSGTPSLVLDELKPKEDQAS